MSARPPVLQQLEECCGATVVRRPGERQRGVEARAVLEPAKVEAFASDLEILAHPVRLQLLALLAGNAGEVCVCDLEAVVPVKQPTVSHHLGVLRRAGIVEVERRGLWAYYRVNRAALVGVRQRIEEGLAQLEGEVVGMAVGPGLPAVG
ncbi:MAG: ArsR/SmtB family transcription factor [Longimicrobiales bacterium]